MTDKTPARVWLTVKDAADYSNLSQEYIRRKIYSKELPAHNMSSKLQPRWLINVQDLDAFIKQR